jgi:uncharacterized DUF497 family protein
MQFNWDPAKRRRNLRDHHIDFEDAVAVFDGHTWERLDDCDSAEERWVAIGLMQGIEVTVVYTDRLVDDTTVRRIISARRATRHEREAFYRGQDR